VTAAVLIRHALPSKAIGGCWLFLRRGDPEAAREEMRSHLNAVRSQLQIG
jgi:hypothetical protein